MLQQLGMDAAADALIKAGEIKPLRIVCPNLDNSRGINSAEHYRELRGKHGVVHKGRYEDYLLDELLPFVDSTFPTIRDRSARYIGGISSGGYTALSTGLRHPELFSKLGGHMPAVDLSYAEEDECYFEDEAMWLQYDPVSIARQHAFEKLQVFLDDGKDDEGQFYRACEKLFQSPFDNPSLTFNARLGFFHYGAIGARSLKTRFRGRACRRAARRLVKRREKPRHFITERNRAETWVDAATSRRRRYETP